MDCLLMFTIRIGNMTRDDEMLVCGSCKSESHISCVSSPGLARLLNPFICASCIGYNDRPGGLGGGFSTSSSFSPSSQSSFPRLRSGSDTTTASMESNSSSSSSNAFDDFSSFTPLPLLPSSTRRSMSASTSSSLSSLEPLSPLSPTPRPGGGIVNPDQKVFENREQFTMWAKSMFITSPNGNAPMELKNT
ncbi:hypothetical protein P389DRAFT_7870 [Cystobasidium minutum MCA 4210]|uniref:uncharacterized protein n=1 Tax=Cystobasidium minutum MCA 4210 TaxID=1397322 RepID=UPI0034CD862C|eukprot:jgi/Rhomi1/7870/CE7869_260